MRRDLTPAIREGLEEKIVLLSGPRQVGKTTLSKSLFEPFEYFNFDAPEDRLALKERSWDRKKSLVVFDELHKMKNWKPWIKGIYDKEGVRPRILVTGSSRMDVVRKMGESLAGRFFQYRLYPLDIKEARSEVNPEEAYTRILRFGGFPEPFLKANDSFYGQWKRSHLDIILRQDLLDLEAPRNIASIETLVALLQRRVGSPVSYSSLARDLERDPKTIKRWLKMLEDLFVIFPLTPYHRNVARSLLKEPKYYFYDIGRVVGDEGQKLENLVALSLRKELDGLRDTRGTDYEFHYLRTKEGCEIDFFVRAGTHEELMIEVKTADSSISSHFSIFSKFFPKARKIQLVRTLAREKTFPDRTEVRSVIPWLAEMPVVR